MLSFYYRVDTLIDILEKLIKRGQPRDRILASEIACLFCVQLGEDDSTKLFSVLKPVLISIVTDDSISPDERAAVRNSFPLNFHIFNIKMGLICGTFYAKSLFLKTM